jgi:DNA-binding MarR family transcriptional regulator
MASDVNPSRPFDPRLFLMDQELDRGVALILGGGRALNRTAEGARDETGLSKAQIQILMLLRYQPGLTVSQARDALAMTVPTFARLAGELDELGLIVRERSHTDGRRHALSLSDAGLTVTAPFATALRDQLRLAFRAAGPDSVAGARLLLEALTK